MEKTTTEKAGKLLLAREKKAKEYKHYQQTQRRRNMRSRLIFDWLRCADKVAQ